MVMATAKFINLCCSAYVKIQSKINFHHREGIQCRQFQLTYLTIQASATKNFISV